jgi:arsenical pump membrane protein
MEMHSVLTWLFSLTAIACILTRPLRAPEWFFAVAGALLLTITGLIPLAAAGSAIIKGVDVYLFLLGMMALSEMAREEGVFDFFASRAVGHARGSSRKLFLLLYGTGTLVTIFLSNDATAVVLTPAILAAVKKANAKPLPYLFACALIANAASFVLPISNPANLVVYASKLPPLGKWLSVFFLPSVAAILLTLGVLLLYFWNSLKASLEQPSKSETLARRGKLVLAGVAMVAALLLFASSRQWDLGLPTFLLSALLLTVVSIVKKKFPRQELRCISWGVVPLVAGLFVIVEALNQDGALATATRLFLRASALKPLAASFSSSFGVALLANFLNNLPVGLTSGAAVQHSGVSTLVKNAVLIGVDLGPNLSVTGSLATLLWLMAIRREGEKASGIDFFKLGLIAMPVALAGCLLVLVICAS